MNIALEVENDTSMSFEGKDRKAGSNNLSRSSPSKLTQSSLAETRNGRPENGSAPDEDETESEVPDEQPVGLLQVFDQANPVAPVTRSPSCWELSDQQAENMLFPDTSEEEDLEGESFGKREAALTSASSSSTLITQPASREAATASRKTSSVNIAEAAAVVQAQRSSNTEGKRLRIGSPKWYFTSSSSSSSER